MANPIPHFAITGVGGYVAPRHLQAIREVGGALLAALDPHDAVGLLDKHFPDADFFTEPERFERHLDKLRRTATAIDYLSICAPNHLHDAHVRMALHNGVNALCEKPLTLNPWNLDALENLERTTEKRVWTVLQLRLHPAIVALRDKLAQETKRHNVSLAYVTPRGRWYHRSWKGDTTKSGGLVTNIGVHFLDILLWLFGGLETTPEVTRSDGFRSEGTMTLQRADVTWTLSIDRDDSPNGGPFRCFEVDGEEIVFSDGFTDLHTEVYRRMLSGSGFGIADARASVELAHRLRTYAP